MGIFDFLTGEFIDVIHWVDDTRDTMVWRFEREGHEIKYGAKLTVREGQAAVFVHEGQLADVFTPGLYMLETNNMPILTTLQHWDHGFQSPFKSEVYFVNTTRFNDLKWGTKNPIMLRDPEFGPTRIRAYGTYTVRVKDPAKFLVEIVGTDGEFTMDEISFQIRNIIVQEFSRVIAGSGIPVLDMAANTADLGKLIAAEVSPVLDGYTGWTCPSSTSRTSRCRQRLRPLWTSAPLWGWLAIWANSPNIRQPRRWQRRPTIPVRVAAWVPVWAWAWEWPWRSRWPTWQRVSRAARGDRPPPLPRNRQHMRRRRLHLPLNMSGTLRWTDRPAVRFQRPRWDAWPAKGS